MSPKNMKNRSKIRNNRCWENLKKTSGGIAHRNTVSKNQLPRLKIVTCSPRTDTQTDRQTDRHTDRESKT